MIEKTQGRYRVVSIPPQTVPQPIVLDLEAWPRAEGIMSFETANGSVRATLSVTEAKNLVRSLVEAIRKQPGESQWRAL